MENLTKKNTQNIEQSKKILLSNALNLLYSLEDITGYENKNIGEAINLLQLELQTESGIKINN